MAQRCPEQILRHKSLTSYHTSQDSECTKSMMIALTIGPGTKKIWNPDPPRQTRANAMDLNHPNVVHQIDVDF